MRAHIPNILTSLRILFAITGALALYTAFGLENGQTVFGLTLEPGSRLAADFSRYAFVAFFISAATDWLDGYLARRWQVESGFGAVLDPIADKLLVDLYLLVYTLMLAAPPEVYVPVIAIILRDAAVTVRRLASKTPSQAAPVSLTAKLKTALAMSVAGLPLIALPLGWLAHEAVLLIWIGGLWLAAALALQTGLSYFRPNGSAND
ncbi:CDP-alcohol phosphatidyltransferase family protein [Maricaulis sp.]|uniref:CDP-alcohol phosphatidyltransferase family protein n=1 Tax=Maricaulis sp. TaxID=1486257 RepID=UPI0026130EAD|nr:CDP-alcohol phosphatidyltransferase family protein [Maricaulis sp.]